MKLILPKVLVPLSSVIGMPLIYLAGPIRGANDWQAKAAQMIDERCGGVCAVVNPSRYDENHSLYRYKAEGDETVFERQTDWEDFYMTAAASRGCLLFWLPRESRENPRPRAEGPYAQDTLGELGYWRAWTHMSVQGRALSPFLSIGAEFGFPGFKKLERDFDRAAGGSFPMHTTLADTVKTAVHLARLSA